jgi:hypothetical protein
MTRCPRPSRPLNGIPVRVACGTSDAFLPGVRVFLAAVPTWPEGQNSVGTLDSMPLSSS